MVMNLMQVSAAPVPSGTVQAVFTQMAYATPMHSMTYDGSITLEYTNPSTSVETSKTTATGSVSIAVSTHAGLVDTRTLLDGFVRDATHDSTAGTAVSTASGLVQSAAAGGVDQVNPVTGTPITQYDADTFPRSGALQVKGMKGALLMTAISATDVRLDLDADGNGT